MLVAQNSLGPVCPVPLTVRGKAPAIKGADSGGRTPNLRFEFLATWPGANWLRGPEESLCTSRDRAGGGGVTFAARRTKFSLPGFGHVSEVA